LLAQISQTKVREKSVYHDLSVISPNLSVSQEDEHLTSSLLKSGERGDYCSFRIVEYDRGGFSASPGVYAWVGEVALILEPHLWGFR